MTDSADEVLVAACGSYEGAVELLVHFNRTLWDLAFPRTNDVPDNRDANFIVLKESEVHAGVARSARRDLRRQVSHLFDSLVDRKLARRATDGLIGFTFSVLQPIGLARDILGSLQPYHQLRYFSMRSIRAHYEFAPSSIVARGFRLLSEAFKDLLAEAISKKPREEPVADMRRRRVSVQYRDFVGTLEGALIAARTSDVKIVSLFIECCRAVSYIRPDYKRGCIVIAPSVDPEYLMSHLFGLSTGIEGFDELFGGGGLMLVDEVVPPVGGSKLGARTILTMGRYATGKSLLALQVAVEVASKGGLAWVMPLEQSVEECLYVLNSMCALPKANSIAILTDTLSDDLLQHRDPQAGAIVFRRTAKESFENFRTIFLEYIQTMQAYPIRLIVVDPINSILREDQPFVSRSNTLSLFEDAKRLGTNVWLIAEEDSDLETQSLFEQNIADTVIHLSLKEKHGYVQRYMEVTKSRLQREERGKHPYAILPGKGISVSPSPAAVDERVRARALRPPGSPASFGIEALDEILGTDAIHVGDVIVLDGPSGSLKTQLGLFFALSTSRFAEENRSQRLRPVRNLLIAARDDSTSIEWLLTQPFLKGKKRVFSDVGEWRVRPLHTGYIQPGYILQSIEGELNQATLDGCDFDRLMIDNVAHWELNCPFVREDDTFGDTLLGLLRRYGLTSLLTCSRSGNRKYSGLQQAVVEGADCVIQFERIQSRGTHKVVLRVLKTRGMMHRRESFEITLKDGSIQITPSSSLVRVASSGAIKAIDVRLFLHAETQMQHEYNDAVLKAVQSVLSVQAKLGNASTMYMGRSLAPVSSIDELQVAQLDTFQLPDVGLPSDSGIRLYAYSKSFWDNSQWGDYYPRFVREQPDGKAFDAVALYANVSLLAYDRNKLAATEVVQDWYSLAGACETWEAGHPGEVFFDFAAETSENYNCLFLEILLSLRKRAGLEVEVRKCTQCDECSLQDWLGGELAVEAGQVMRRLCRRTYFKHPFKRRGPAHADGQHSIEMDPHAIVWRAWYSNLNQLFAYMNPEQSQAIEVAPLPQGISISGEWYLGVPAQSAAPDVGLKLIKFLTSREAELDRLKRGVGLPTRATFYRSMHTSVKTRVSPFFSMNLDTIGDLVAKAFPRSAFDCYAEFSGVLCAHLKSIIELPDELPGGVTVKSETQKIFDSLQQEVSFIRSQPNCPHGL